MADNLGNSPPFEQDNFSPEITAKVFASVYLSESPFEVHHTEPEDFVLVWFSKSLGNWKALLITPHPDGLYFEVTYNKAQDETYVDVYKKVGHHKYEGV